MIYYLLPKGMCSESCDVFNFGEISNNISLTVQDRGIVTLIVNLLWLV